MKDKNMPALKKSGLSIDKIIVIFYNINTLINRMIAPALQCRGRKVRTPFPECIRGCSGSG